jgi:hypothetical protein
VRTGVIGLALFACTDAPIDAPAGLYLRQQVPQHLRPGGGLRTATPQVVQRRAGPSGGVEAWWPHRADAVVPRAGTAIVLDSALPHPSWTVSGGQLVGDGPRRTLQIDPGSTRVDLTACSGLSDRCRSASFHPAPARPRLRFDEVRRLTSDALGSTWEVSGAVLDPAATLPDVELLFLVHTDVWYRRQPRTVVQPDGTFTGTFYALGNVDRFAGVVVPTGLALDSVEGCTDTECVPVTDPASGQWVPWPVDDTTAFAQRVHHLWPQTTLPDWEHNLLSRLGGPGIPGAPFSAALVRASRNRDLFFTYNQATASMAMTVLGHTTEARAILDAMAALQRPDGSWYFTYFEDGSSPFPGEGDFRAAGAIGWMAMAYAAWGHLTGDLTYLPTLTATLDHLESQLIPWGNAACPRFNPTDLPETPWDESAHVATEHAADAYAAYVSFRQLTGDDRYAATEATLRTFLEERWRGDRFSAGSHSVLGENTAEHYLDTQTWTMLALGDDAAPYVDGLRHNCHHFFDPAGMLTESVVQVPGFADLRVWGELPHGPVVWTEGTLGMVSAMRLAARFGEDVRCGGLGADDFVTALESTMGIVDAHGGLPEAMRTDHPGYDPDTTTTALAWYAFAAEGFNPFRPWE